jgi:hypothetical protein
MDGGEPRFDEILMSSSPGRCTQEEEENEVDGNFNLNGKIRPAERKTLSFTSNSQTRTPANLRSHCRKAGMKQQSSCNPSATSLIQVKNGNGVSSSFSIWVNDVQALTSSHEFRCAIDSSSKLISATTGKVIHTALLPITIPVNITTSIASNVIRAANGTICHIVKPFIVNNQKLSALKAKSAEGVAKSQCQDDECDHLTQCQPHIHEKLICAAINVIPVAVGTVARVKDEIGSTLINVLGWHMPSGERSGGDENVPNQSCDPLKYYPTETNSDCENDMPVEDLGECISCEDETKNNNSSLSEGVGNISSSVKFPPGSSERNISGDVETTFFMTISDLGMFKPLSSGSKDELIVRLELKAHSSDREMIDTACAKMVDKVLFLSCMNIDKRSKEVTRRPAWKEEGSTLKYHKQYNKWIGNAKTKNKAIALMEKEVMMWSFAAKKKMNKKEVYGNGVPMFRAKGIISCSPLELLDLLLDSSKVSLYNKHSNGRKDVCILCEGGKDSSRDSGDDTIITKIMRTETKIPLTGKVIRMQTLLHARKIKEEGLVGDTFVLVSRSVDSSSCGREEVKSARSRNEIIWGVNVLREVAGYANKVELTNFSQASSTAVPNFLAHKIGLISLSDFFKNLREMKIRKQVDGAHNHHPREASQPSNHH